MRSETASIFLGLPGVLVWGQLSCRVSAVVVASERVLSFSSAGLARAGAARAVGAWPQHPILFYMLHDVGAAQVPVPQSCTNKAQAVFALSSS